MGKINKDMGVLEMDHIKNVLATAGAFVAWVIGAGFATGQEALRYCSSYGYWSVGVLFVITVGYLFFGMALLLTGYDHREDGTFRQFKYFCGDRLGTLYSQLILFTLILLMPVLYAGAGATVLEHYGWHPYIGSAIIATAVLVSYLIGFKRLVRVISVVGPAIILFVLIIGFLSTWHGLTEGLTLDGSEAIFAEKQVAPHWILSGLLYISLTFFPSSTYCVNIGMIGKNRRALKQGIFLGSFVVLFTIAMLNVTLLLHAKDVATLEVPMLFLARTISPTFASLFSVALVLGVFSSCSVMMWTVCNNFQYGGDKGNRLFAVAIALLTYIMSLFPFGELMGTFYPFIGYIGLIFLSAVIHKTVRSGRQAKMKKG